MALADTTGDTRGTGGQPGKAPGSGHAKAAQPMLHSAVAFAALAAVTAYAGNGRLRHLDQAAIKALEIRRRRPAAVRAAHAVSTLAEPAFAAAMLTAFTAVVARRPGWRAAFLPCLVVAGGTVARRRLSQVIARPRPPAALWMAEPEGFSLPSKHTTPAALTAGACAASAGARGAPRLLVPLLAAAGVGTSRVFLGVHWPSDVLAAWLFAEGWLGLAESAIPALARREGRPAGGGRETTFR